MPEPTSPKTQALVDATTWVPVAFFSFIERPNEAGVLDLCQLWVNVLGQTEWRKIEKRNLADMSKAYAECQSFNEKEPDADFDYR